MSYSDLQSASLGLRKAKHLLRRTSFSYTKELLLSFADLTPEQAVEQLVNTTTNSWPAPYDPLPTGNPDGHWTSSAATFSGQTRKKRIVTAWWWYNALQQNSLKQKASFFLHSCFTVSKSVGGTASASYFFDYVRLLDHYALGNLKDLAKKITFDNAMLIYLNNTRNNARNPNENYAREYLELFTILKGQQIGPEDYTTYTEKDVQIAAKVFSGIKIQPKRDVIDTDTGIPRGKVFVNQHDKTDKTFSTAFNETKIVAGTTEAAIEKEHDDFVDMVFQQEATALSYCKKLYRFFIRSTWDPETEEQFIKPLAQDLITENFELLPILKKLLTSKHFYDQADAKDSDEIIGSIVKSPLNLLSEIVSFFKLEIPHPENNALEFYRFFNFVHNSCFTKAGMPFWEPNTVAGYPAYYQEPDFDRHWYSSNTILPRFNIIQSLLAGRDRSNNNARIYVTLDITSFVEQNMTNPSSSSDLITEFTDLLYPEAVSEERKRYFSKILLGDFPSGYWTSAWINYTSTRDNTIVKTRLEALITVLINAPEFQLM